MINLIIKLNRYPIFRLGAIKGTGRGKSFRPWSRRRFMTSIVVWFGCCASASTTMISPHPSLFNIMKSCLTSARRPWVYLFRPTSVLMIVDIRRAPHRKCTITFLQELLHLKQLQLPRPSKPLPKLPTTPIKKPTTPLRKPLAVRAHSLPQIIYLPPAATRITLLRSSK